jgi:hypothetical protein
MADPYITWPDDDGDTVYGSNVPFDWDANNNTDITGWRLYVGSSAGASDYFDSGILGANQYGVMAQGLPEGGATVYVRLLWFNGSWSTADTTYTNADQEDLASYETSLYYIDECPRWYKCERCYFLFPEWDTAIDPKSGKRVCLVGPRCYDDHEFGRNEIVITGRRDPVYKERD